MGDLHFHEDDAEAALGKLEAAATEAAHAGDSWCRAIASGLVGEARRLLGDLSEARRLLDESIEALRALNDTMGLPLISSSFALLCVQEGDRRTARSFFDESEAMARTQGNVVQLCRILGRRGIGAVECGDLEDARRCLEELEGIVASAGFLPGSPIGKLAAELRERTRGNSESAHHS